MAKIKHPFAPEFIYQVDEDGNIRISNGNAWGSFTKEGIHLSGEIRHADPQLCVWVANNPSPDGQLRSSAVTAKRS